jgi:prolyl-tRNA synthetase
LEPPLPNTELNPARADLVAESGFSGGRERRSQPPASAIQIDRLSHPDRNVVLWKDKLKTNMAESPITPRGQDFAAWYQDVVLSGDMAEPAEIVKGCMVIKANGYAVWEVLQRELDARFKATNHQNVYFPLLIPKSFLEKEAEHVEGFSPELAVVTIAGGKELEEPYVIRPTSETIIGHFFSKWIQSWRDLPMLLNQWANVMRWELRTRLFLRTSEFLWQEGHTAHANHEESLEEVLRILDIYAEVAENLMAMPVIKGVKTGAEKFAGALKSYSIEAMMQNGLALQAGTSHDLGQNFGKAFDVKFQNKEGQLDYVWQTSWGVSTRLIGGLIMTHSDDKGLVLPPKLAPVKTVLVPIYRKDNERAQVLEAAHRIAAEVGAKVDDREGQTPGAKFFHWERRGVPVVLELGPRDLAAGKIVIKRRDTGVKEPVGQDELAARLPATLEAMQTDLLRAARQRLKDNTVLANSVAEVESILADVSAEKGGGKFVMAHLKDDPRCDARVREFKATVRNIPLADEFDGPGTCIVTGEPVDRRAVIAKAY